MGGLEKQGVRKTKSMRMEGRLKGMSDLRICILSAHLGSGPHAWPDPVTQTPNRNFEMEERAKYLVIFWPARSHT